MHNREFRHHGGVLGFGGPSGEDVSVVGREAAEDSRYLLGRFALGEDNFGYSLAEGAMVVELGKTEVFERQVAQALNGFVGSETLAPDLVEDLP
jgi:hypothetical protein